MAGGFKCEERDKLALVPKTPIENPKGNIK